MKPTVGRIVHFYRDNLVGGMEGPWPAIIVQVHSDTCVSLHAWKRDNVQEFGSSVMMRQPPMTPGNMYWEWPPRDA
jgi:hypothetical protein